MIVFNILPSCLIFVLKSFTCIWISIGPEKALYYSITVHYKKKYFLMRPDADSKLWAGIMQ